MLNFSGRGIIQGREYEGKMYFDFFFMGGKVGVRSELELHLHCGKEVEVTGIISSGGKGIQLQVTMVK